MNSSDRIENNDRSWDVSQSQAFLDQLFVKIELGWELDRNPDLVDSLASQYPEHALALYDFLAVIVESEQEIDDENSRQSRARTNKWLENEGFEIARNIAAEERRKLDSTTPSTPPINGPSPSTINPSPRSARQRRLEGHNTHFNEAVILGVLAKNFSTNAYPLGRMRRTKFAYLLHRHCEGLAQGFLKKAAGPYNPTIRYGGSEKIAINKGYVVEHRNGFLVGAKVGEAEAYFDNWYGPECLSWLERFRFYKNEELELLTTVDMAVVELRSRQSAVNVSAVKQVLAANNEWAKKLARPIFCDINIAREIKQSVELFGS